MSILEKLREYHLEVPYIVNIDDYKDAQYQFDSEYYNAMVKALKLTQDDFDALDRLQELDDSFDISDLLPVPTFTTYHIQVNYEYVDYSLYEDTKARIQ